MQFNQEIIDIFKDLIKIYKEDKELLLAYKEDLLNTINNEEELISKKILKLITPQSFDII